MDAQAVHQAVAGVAAPPPILLASPLASSSVNTPVKQPAGFAATPDLPSSTVRLGAPASRSVLSALRSLQEKIRRVEAERQHYKDAAERWEAKADQVQQAREADAAAAAARYDALREETKQQRDGLETSVRSVNDEADQLRSELVDVRRTLQRSQTDLQSAQSQLDLISKELNDTRQRNAELSGRLTSAEHAVEDARSNADAARRDADAARLRAGEAEAQTEALREQLRQLQDVNLSLVRQAESLAGRRVQASHEQAYDSTSFGGIPSARSSPLRRASRAVSAPRPSVDSRATADDRQRRPHPEFRDLDEDTPHSVEPPTMRTPPPPPAAPSQRQPRASIASSRTRRASSSPARYSAVTSAFVAAHADRIGARRGRGRPRSAPGHRRSDVPPWNFGTSTGLSHSLSTNAQQILARIKHHAIDHQDSDCRTCARRQQGPSAVAERVHDVIDRSTCSGDHIDAEGLARVIAEQESEFRRLNSRYEMLHAELVNPAQSQQDVIAEEMAQLVQQMEEVSTQLQQLRTLRALPDQPLTPKAHDVEVAVSTRRVEAMRLLRSFQSYAKEQA